MGFAIGVLKKGLSGGLLSGALFQGPGLLILAILGWVASKVLDDPPAWLEGLVAGECPPGSPRLLLPAALLWRRQGLLAPALAQLACDAIA